MVVFKMVVFKHLSTYTNFLLYTLYNHFKTYSLAIIPVGIPESYNTSERMPTIIKEK